MHFRAFTIIVDPFKLKKNDIFYIIFNVFSYDVVCICLYGIHIFLISCVFSNHCNMRLINYARCKHLYKKCKLRNDDNDNHRKMANVKRNLKKTYVYLIN